MMTFWHIKSSDTINPESSVYIATLYYVKGRAVFHKYHMFLWYAQI